MQGLPFPNYNIPSNNRELQLPAGLLRLVYYYNIPSNNRELQLPLYALMLAENYNIPSNNRELQRSNGTSED